MVFHWYIYIDIPILITMTPDDQAADLFSVAESLYSLLAVVMRHDRSKVSITASTALALIDRAGPKRISELAQSEGITQPSMTALVSGLEADGLVQRRPDPSDGRAVLVELSEAGREYRHQRVHSGATRLVQLIEKLSAQQRQELLDAGEALAQLRLLSDKEFLGAS